MPANLDLAGFRFGVGDEEDGMIVESYEVTIGREGGRTVTIEAEALDMVNGANGESAGRYFYSARPHDFPDILTGSSSGELKPKTTAAKPDPKYDEVPKSRKRTIITD